MSKAKHITLAGMQCNPCVMGVTKNSRVEEQLTFEKDIVGLIKKEVERLLASFHFPNNPLLIERLYLEPKEAATLLKISYLTILEYIKSGDLIASNLGSETRPHYRIENKDFDRFLLSRKKFASLVSMRDHKQKAI